MQSETFKKMIVSGLNNILIWYNYNLFMPFFLVLSVKFFPAQQSQFVSMILGFCVFGLGLFIRPFGSIIFGKIGDKVSREKSIGYSLLLLSISTVCIGICPGFESIGWLSTIILILARAGQGVAMGGAVGISMVHLVEMAPKHLKGFGGSIATAAVYAGVLVANIALSLVIYFYGSDFKDSIGWRIPFILGSLLLPYAISQLLTKTTVHEVDCAVKEPLFRELLKKFPMEIICVITLTAFNCICFYIVFAFLPNYMLAKFPGVSVSIVTYTNFALFFTVMISGYISDIVGRLVPVFVGIILAAISSILIVETCDMMTAIMWLIPTVGFAFSCVYGTSSTYMAEIFPEEVRCTILTLPMSLSQAIFGGITPIIATSLTEYSFKLVILPIVIASLASLCILLLMKKKRYA